MAEGYTGAVGGEQALRTFAAFARRACGPETVIDDLLERQAYSCDGLTAHRAVPGLVFVPRTSDELITGVRELIRLGVPFVARGAGTGLSGGALPETDGVVVVLARLTRILEVDPISQLAIVEPGVVNATLSAAVRDHGLYFVPDPSSQVACTIGGNVAENSGGAHCFKYGFTTNHILGVEVLTPTGDLVMLGGESMDVPGPDLRGVFIGSEGTLGIAVRIVCRLMTLPLAHRTMVAYFADVVAAGDAVTHLIRAGIVPAAIEMMDRGAMAACEAATGAGLSLAWEAALLVELDGTTEEVQAGLDQVRACVSAAGAGEVWVASTEAERDRMWRARKAAFAAAGRVAPAYIVQDGVIPRTALARVLESIRSIGREAGLTILNVFHAGDGNLHPLVTYDPNEPGAYERAERAASDIVRVCLSEGGSLTGEHGVGIDKVCMMPEQFTSDDLATFWRLRRAVDPAGLANPGKLLPTPRLCGERPGRYVTHPLESLGVASRW